MTDSSCAQLQLLQAGCILQADQLHVLQCSSGTGVRSYRAPVFFKQQCELCGRWRQVVGIVAWPAAEFLNAGALPQRMVCLGGCDGISCFDTEIGYASIPEKDWQVSQGRAGALNEHVLLAMGQFCQRMGCQACTRAYCELQTA